MTEFSSVVHAAADGNEEALQAMEDLDPFVDIDRRLREYGLAVCGAEG